jgi:hypothetical protein
MAKTPEQPPRPIESETLPQQEGIPVMITRPMHQQLELLGYKKEDRSKLTPQEAWDILHSSIPKPAGEEEPVVPEVTAALEAEEQAEIDKNIEARRAGEKEGNRQISSDELLSKMEAHANKNGNQMADALGRATQKTGKGIEVTKAPENTQVSDELVAIFGQSVPPDVVGLYNKLSGNKRTGYLEKLRSDAEEKKKKKQQKIEKKRKSESGSRRQPRSAPENPVAEPSVTEPAIKEETIKLNHPNGSLGVYTELKKLDKELESIYPDGVPSSVLEHYLSLRDRMPEALQLSHDEQRKVALEAQLFIQDQRLQANPLLTRLRVETNRKFGFLGGDKVRIKRPDGSIEDGWQAYELQDFNKKGESDKARMIVMVRKKDSEGQWIGERITLAEADIEKVGSKSEELEKVQTQPEEQSFKNAEQPSDFKRGQKVRILRSDGIAEDDWYVAAFPDGKVLVIKDSPSGERMKKKISPERLREMQGMPALVESAPAEPEVPSQKESAETIPDYDAQRHLLETGFKSTDANSEAHEGIKKKYVELKRVLAQNSYNPPKTWPQIKEFLNEIGANTEVDTMQKHETANLSVENTEAPDAIIVDPEDIPGYIRVAANKDATPKEQRRTLGYLVSQFEKTKEKIKNYASSSEELVRRSKDLDLKAEEIGITERGFRALGEKYNALGFKSKVAIGVGLGLGAGIGAAAASLPAIIAFGGALALQRTAGLATMYLKFEKNAFPEDKLGKEKAMAKAILYTAGMTAGTLIAVQEISKTEWAKDAGDWVGKQRDRLITWLNDHYPFGQQAKVDLAGNPNQPASPRAEAVVPVPESTPGIPDITVEAKAGRGYEYALKRLWEQVQEKHLDPTTFSTLDKGSHLRQLVAATPENIDAVVHRIASDTGFVRPDGVSAIIQPGDLFTFRTDGNVGLVGVEAEPAINPPTDRFPSPSAPESVSAPEQALAADKMSNPQYIDAQEKVPTGEPEKIRFPEPISQLEETKEMPQPQVFRAEPQTLTAEPEPGYGPKEIPATPVETEARPEQESGYPNKYPMPEPPAPSEIFTSSQETAAPLTIEVTTEAASPAEQAPAIIKNEFGISVPLNEAHIYSDARGNILAFGGTPAQKIEAITDFLTKHPDKVVFAADDGGKVRIPWSVLGKEIIPGPPMYTSGFLGFFSEKMKPPAIEEFEQFIK